MLNCVLVRAPSQFPEKSHNTHWNNLKKVLSKLLQSCWTGDEYESNRQNQAHGVNTRPARSLGNTQTPTDTQAQPNQYGHFPSTPMPAQDGVQTGRGVQGLVLSDSLAALNGPSVPVDGDIFRLSRREVERTIAEMEVGVSEDLQSPLDLSSRSRETYPERSEAQGMLSSLLSSRFEASSAEPCEAPSTDRLHERVQDASKQASYGSIESSSGDMTCIPLVNSRIRYTRHSRRASAEEAALTDRELDYTQSQNAGEEGVRDMTSSAQEVVDTQLEENSSLPNGFAMASDLDRGCDTLDIKAEVQSFVDDVNKAAENMAQVTKKRSDLLVERVRILQSQGRVDGQESEIENMLQKVVECERQNRELKECLLKAKEQVSATCRTL